MMNDEMQKVYDSFVLPEKDKEMIYEKIISGTRRRQPMSKWMKAAVIAGCLLVGTSSVYAAVNLLKPSEVAEHFEDKKLAEKFAALSDHIVTKENDKYRVSYLGEVSGKNMSDVMESDQSMTYYVMALERKGDEPLTEYDDLTATPFVKGIAPWKYNIWWLGGGSTYDTIDDGIRYYLFSCDDVEIFADKGVYLGVCDAAPSSDMYTYDEKTGEIGCKEDYTGTNLLFELDIDPSKADPNKQEKVLKQLQKNQGMFYDMEAQRDPEEDDVGFVDPETGENPLKGSHYTADEFMALSEKKQDRYLENYGTLVLGSSKEIKVDQDGCFSYEWKGKKGKDIIDIKEKNNIKAIDCKKSGMGNVIGCFATDDAFYIEVASLNPDDENTVTCALYRIKTE